MQRECGRPNLSALFTEKLRRHEELQVRSYAFFASSKALTLAITWKASAM
jgi:hypothetical protein